MGTKIDGGGVSKSKDDSGGGAIITGSGKGTEDDPHIHTTTCVDKDGNESDIHTTVEVNKD
jgi:hypothetical protein